MNLLFICTHNRCRSVLSEAITRHLVSDTPFTIAAASAGSQPVGEVHPWTLKFLAERNISTEGLKSQSWDEFESFKPDVVFTVCDNAANESCPLWFDETIKVHWGLPDPSKIEGSLEDNEDEIRRAFFAVMDTIETRIQALLALDVDALTPAALEAALIAIAEQH